MFIIACRQAGCVTHAEVLVSILIKASGLVLLQQSTIQPYSN